MSENFSGMDSAIGFGLRYIDIDLTSARDNVEIKIPGATRIYCAQDAFDSATVLSTTLSVGHAFARFNNNTDAPVIMKKGRLYMIEPSGRMFFTNTAQANKMMRLYHSVGAIILPYASEVEIVGDIPATQTPGTDFNILTGAAGLIAANADRKECLVQSDTELRLSSVTAKGLLWDGSNMVITSKGQIDFFNDTAGTAAVKFTEFST